MTSVDTSVANFAKWGWGVPHMHFKPPMRTSPRGGGYLYVHIYIYPYVQISFVQVIWDKRSQGQGQDYTPPPPCGRTPAGGALGALLLCHEAGV